MSSKTLAYTVLNWFWMDKVLLITDVDNGNMTQTTTISACNDVSKRVNGIFTLSIGDDWYDKYVTRVQFLDGGIYVDVTKNI